MTVRVGELNSQVEVQAGAGGTGAPAGPAGGQEGAVAPTWAEREKHLRIEAARRRDAARVTGGGFDG